MKKRESILEVDAVMDGFDESAYGSPKILVVDDEQKFLQFITSILLMNGYRARTACSLEEAKRELAGSPYDIVFLDIGLPDGSGFSLLDYVSERFQDLLVVIITGTHDLDTAVRALRMGAFDYITKPFSISLFEDRLTRVVDEWRARNLTRSYQQYLEDLVTNVGRELSRTEKQIDQVHDLTVLALGAALDLKNPETEEHCRRVSENSIRLGKRLGVRGNALRDLGWGAYLHDIGKIGVPENILLKAGPLTEEEFKHVRKHSEMGYSMLAHIDFLSGASEIVLCHHEKYDGSGYPFGLKGDEIPFLARIFAIIDAFDALVSNRVYRMALSYNEAIMMLKQCEGSHFDPSVVEAFVGFPPEQLQFEGNENRKEVRQSGG
jgi:response regulator RpfG family c-di-GMP phosphodiesterase